MNDSDNMNDESNSETCYCVCGEQITIEEAVFHDGQPHCSVCENCESEE